MTLDKLKRSNFQFFIVNKNLKKATTNFFFANVVALFNNTHLTYIASQPGAQEANLRQTVSPDSRSHTHPRIYIITYGTRQLSRRTAVATYASTALYSSTPLSTEDVYLRVRIHRCVYVRGAVVLGRRVGSTAGRPRVRRYPCSGPGSAAFGSQALGPHVCHQLRCFGRTAAGLSPRSSPS